MNHRYAHICQQRYATIVATIKHPNDMPGSKCVGFCHWQSLYIKFLSG